MKISVLCSSVHHPIYATLRSWVASQQKRHAVQLVDRKDSLSGGDILFLISCTEPIDKVVRSRYKSVLVVHASDLPQGRGWSPHIWQILEGKKLIKVTLLEAEDPIDSGDIWGQRDLIMEGHELYDEINEKLFDLELDLMNFAVAQFGSIIPTKQRNEKPTYYARRGPDDSRLDANKTLAEQFDLLRVADPERFPAFFDYRGHRYYMRITKGNR
jgi:methionyl-tRNA formyltransferase